MALLNILMMNYGENNTIFYLPKEKQCLNRQWAMNKSYTGGPFEPSLNPLWIHLNPTVSVMVSNTKREWIVFIALFIQRRWHGKCLYNNVLRQ